MAHIFLSPHMDDAVLSCGGLIDQLAQAGESVTVFSVMAGGVPLDVPISPFIEEHFRRWKLWPDPVPGRKAEDTRAVQSLGGHVRFGDFPDLLYRTDGQGSPLCPDLSAMFGEIDPRDPVLSQMHHITGWLDPAATIYAPLGAGRHVDHQLVRDAVLRWSRTQPGVAVFFYEEYPYSAQGADAVQTALDLLDRPTVPVIHYLSDKALEAKIRAIACYESQISTFWDDYSMMAESVRQYAAHVGHGRYAERLWLERDNELVSDAQQNPLETARQLVGVLRQQADGDLKSKLAELDQLLAAAQQRGIGQDAEALRQRIEEMIATNAQFNSVMVHEIRVPMTSIRGYADMLSKNVVGELNDMQMQFAETIRSNVIRMEHLVTDISDISKLKSGRLRFDAKMDMYKNIAMQAQKTNADLAAAHNHTLTFETPDGLPLLNLDSLRLAQALNKLIINALQYTPDGGQITVRAEAVSGKLKVMVIDNGVGMSAEEQTHIGELFWRADNDLVRSFKGHGLGLSITIGFIEQLGGEFFFESEPDKGSTFGFIVPGMN